MAWDVSLAKDSLHRTRVPVFMRAWVWQYATPAALLTLCSVECVSLFPADRTVTSCRAAVRVSELVHCARVQYPLSMSTGSE